MYVCIRNGERTYLYVSVFECLQSGQENEQTNNKFMLKINHDECEFLSNAHIHSAIYESFTIKSFDEHEWIKFNRIALHIVGVTLCGRQPLLYHSSERIHENAFCHG